MYSGSADQSIIKWNIESFRVVATIPGHENPVCTLAVDKIRQRLYSGSLKSIKVDNVIICNIHIEYNTAQHTLLLLYSCIEYIPRTHTLVSLF